MSSNKLGNISRTLLLVGLAMLGSNATLRADDTEIYKSNSKPKVLIAIDDSGSMRDPPAGGGPPKMDTAIKVIGDLISDNPGIDFGLLEFNGNWPANRERPIADANGGRIVSRILANMTKTQRSKLLTDLSKITASGSTPLCESTYEAYRYLSGQTLVYGGKGAYYERFSRLGINLGFADILPRDEGAENPAGTYKSPVTDCNVYIVVVTDGEPDNDTDANARIETLTGKTCKTYPAFGSTFPVKNCLPEIAGYMANTDLDRDSTNGNQYGITYTIGFDTDQRLLQDAAVAGQGLYFTANSDAELTAAFIDLVRSIESKESTFTSPAVAVDTFSRTQSREEVFYTMFKPDQRIDWRGNIKKLKVATSGGSVTLVDANGDDAIDPATGFIKDTATTFWSPSADGAKVEAGGVGGLLAARDPATRVIKSNTDTAGALQDFNSTNLNYAAFGFADAAQLFTFFGVTDQAELDTLIAWARGSDVYDEDEDTVTSETRPWVLGDILHSQPLVVNYGALGSFTKDEPDLRLVVGTNAGFVHMFGNDNGDEDWAFFPKELAPVLRQRATNPVSSQHVYGVDNTPVLYTLDVDRDGTIDASDKDKAYVYLTLRRGGDAIYALDISNPGSPAFLWKLDPSQSGFAEMGQTWSRPVVTKIPGYKDSDGKSKPVLIFAAGYDTNKDATGVVTADAVGRGLFIVDAATGALLWQVTPAADSATNMQETGLTHSVASTVTPLDSNGDALTDRVYFGDTGGNVWRVDLPGATLPTSSQDTFRIIKLAELNGGTAATDRRFFNAPDLVRTKYQGQSFDAVAIGSGDRNNPNSTDVDDQFYMLRDTQVLPYFTEFVRSSACDTDPKTIDDFRCNLPLSVDDLYDVTANAIQSVDADTRDAAVAALGSANGWRLDLTAPGEKSMAKSLTLGGKVYFTTFSPGLDAEKVCEPTPGTGRLYSVRLTDATSDYDRVPMIECLDCGILSTVSLYFGEDGEIRLVPPPGAPPPEDQPGTCGNGILCPGDKLPDPYGSFWYQEEY